MLNLPEPSQIQDTLHWHWFYVISGFDAGENGAFTLMKGKGSANARGRGYLK